MSWRSPATLPSGLRPARREAGGGSDLRPHHRADGWASRADADDLVQDVPWSCALPEFVHPERPGLLAESHAANCAARGVPGGDSAVPGGTDRQLHAPLKTRSMTLLASGSRATSTSRGGCSTASSPTLKPKRGCFSSNSSSTANPLMKSRRVTARLRTRSTSPSRAYWPVCAKRRADWWGNEFLGWCGAGGYSSLYFPFFASIQRVDTTSVPIVTYVHYNGCWRTFSAVTPCGNWLCICHVSDIMPDPCPGRGCDENECIFAKTSRDLALVSACLSPVSASLGSVSESLRRPPVRFSPFRQSNEPSSPRSSCLPTGASTV